MKNKYRQERYITQIYNKTKDTWTFRVRYKGIDESFWEGDFLDAKDAFNKAVAYRNKLLYLPKIQEKTRKYTVQECYEQIEDIYLIRSETKRKLDCFYNNYIQCKKMNIDEVTRAHIIKDLNDMAEKCSNDTISRVFSIWRKIYGVALAKEYIDRDMTLQIQLPKSRKIKSEKRQELTDEQTINNLCELLEKGLKSPLERKQAPLMIKILFYTGMRPAEMLGLHKSDINLKKKTISIQREVDTDRNQTNVRPCKTEMSHRVIPVNKKAITLLKKAIKLSDGEILFEKDGGYYSSKDIGDRYHQIGIKKGIDFHMYQCRHTFITNLFMKGIDIKTIQMLVGQNVDATTIGYVVTSEERMRNAVNLI